MRARCSVFIATSLDGFISRLDGSIDWLNEANAAVPPGEDCGYKAFIGAVDTLVMGRNTFEQALTFEPWPYGEMKVVVLTSRPIEIPPALRSSVTASADPPATLVEKLSRDGSRHLYIDGGKTIQGFVAAGLVDEMTITVIPVLLGEGRPLFGPLKADVKLRLVSSRAYDFGFVQTTYRAP